MGNIPPRAWVSSAEKPPHCSRGGIPAQVDGVLQSLRRPASPAIFCFWQETRLKEGIVRLQPQEEPLRSELLSGKFTVLVRACVIPEMECPFLWNITAEVGERAGHHCWCSNFKIILGDCPYSDRKEWEIGVDSKVSIDRCSSWTSCVR